MRRLLIGLCVLSLTAAFVAPSAARTSKKRVVELPYKTPVVGANTPAASGWYFDCFSQIGCVLIDVKGKDRFLSLEITDATGLPVYAQLRDPNGGVYAHIYGSTDKPLGIGGPYIYTLHILPGTSPLAQPSAPTTGIVTATFSR
jgi:type II secretory pathway pseudopilin PulG